jgi:hydroxypyruvate reductase
VLRLFGAALTAVEPRSAVRGSLAYDEKTLFVQGDALRAPSGVHVVAVGKAAVAMTRSAFDAIGDAIISGDVITKEGHVDESLPAEARVFEAGHPIPDQRGVDATRAALERLNALPEGAVVLALISGGGSALLEAPNLGVSLEDLATTTDLLLRAGAPIGALNAVRAPLSRVKAGGLRRAAPRARWVTLILSDVLGNDPRVIASGPTVVGQRDPGLALEVIKEYGVDASLPQSVLTALRSERHTLRDDEVDGDFLVIVGDNASAVSAAASEATETGHNVAVVWTAMEGEARERGREFVALARNAAEDIDVLLGGGELTVTVRGDGIGGRNTEFALAAALELERRGMEDWVIASLGSDGQDAATELAGAIADAGTAQRARKAGVDPEAALAMNDSLAVFEAAGGGVKTGPTGTNVNDLYIAVRRRAAAKHDRREAG